MRNAVTVAGAELRLFLRDRSNLFFVFVFPLLHPAAALRTPSLVETLREDFSALAAQLHEPLPEPLSTPDPATDSGEADRDRADQLDLFGG